VTPEEHEAFIEAGRLLFAGPIAFELGVVSMDHLPPADVPEVAFAGRSNVGKSSLINAVTGRNKLARSSTEPGRTRELNFFRVGDRLRLVVRLRQGRQGRHCALDVARARLSARACGAEARRAAHRCAARAEAA
jgi:hypothetical protein